jgi:hypothetical protein
MYSIIEHTLIAENLVANGNYNPSEGQINQSKGVKRKEILGANSTLLISRRQAKIIRERFIDSTINNES